MRVKDPVWRDFLTSLRQGNINATHLQMLRKLVLGKDDCPNTSFDEEPWASSVLITPRHALRLLWNERALMKHCALHGQRLYRCEAKDTIGGRPLSLNERYAVALRKHGPDRKNNATNQDLQENVDLAIGMTILVTQNINTDLDITNGARGVIVSIVLHPEEVLTSNDAQIKLQHLPAYILVRMERTRLGALDGLTDSVIPIEPVIQKMQIKVETEEGQLVTRIVARSQFPVTPCYAFTDYRSQGQTVHRAIVDIATPASGRLSLFNLYVMLSRVASRDCIRILRDFKNECFLDNSFPAELKEEEDRLWSLHQTWKTYE